MQKSTTGTLLATVWLIDTQDELKKCRESVLDIEVLMNATVHHRDSSSQGLANAGSRTPVSSKFADLKINTTELFTFHLPSLFSFPPFLNTLPSEARGVVDELFLGDSSPSWTNHPT
ncbi:hypothetical protein AVEN_59094-1 [Araneus ventricosus]|uniref:Uncharacterized protein n=1 Tax=Araneus ventricosus TaxID=182803 RepID=A0A4Y2ADQ7_ARAVE|nr:hypothetical protein AVEN_59094-1 [Araneus ventricosus]